MLNISPILIVSSNKEHTLQLENYLSQHHLRWTACSSVKTAAQPLIDCQGLSLVISEDMLPDGDFRSIVAIAKHHCPQLPVVVVSERAEWDSYLAALNAGAFDYLTFPLEQREAERILWSALFESKRQEINSQQYAA